MSNLPGIDSNYQQDAILGVIMGAAFVVINKISPVITLGLPALPMAMETEIKWLILIAAAPVLEEILFRGVFMSVFENFLKLGTAAIIAQAILFSLYHISAYGSGLQSAFIGALIFGIIAGLLVKYSNSLLPSMIAHSIFNAYLVYSGYIIIGGV